MYIYWYYFEPSISHYIDNVGCVWIKVNQLNKLLCYVLNTSVSTFINTFNDKTYLKMCRFLNTNGVEIHFRSSLRMSSSHGDFSLSKSQGMIVKLPRESIYAGLVRLLWGIMHGMAYPLNTLPKFGLCVRLWRWRWRNIWFRL